MNFEEQVKSNCGDLPFKRVTLTQFDQLELTGISKALVFIFARWSGVAVLSFRILCQALTEHPATEFPIIVIDADELDIDAFCKFFGELPQGKGEAFWIDHEQIIARDHGYTNESYELLRVRIRSFLSTESEGGT